MVWETCTEVDKTCKYYTTDCFLKTSLENEGYKCIEDASGENCKEVEKVCQDMTVNCGTQNVSRKRNICIEPDTNGGN